MSKISSATDLAFTEEELQLLLQNIDQLSEHELVEVNKMVEELERREDQKGAQDDLIEFCKRMDPSFIVGRHHRILANELMAIERGPLAEDGEDRVCVNIPPRHGKSHLVSTMFPAWFLGRNPSKKVMMVSHTTDLAVDFGRKVRNIIASDDYRSIFPNVSLAQDSKSAGRWNTNFGGEYFACIYPDTEVSTQHGRIRADAVVPGDYILSHSGYVPVHSTMRTSHSERVVIRGTSYSKDHPIWTMNRGWVEAGSISPNDVLLSESILDRMKALVIGVTDGLMEYPYVPKMVQHKEQVREPEKRQVPFLWRAWDIPRRAMARFSDVPFGHGGAAFVETYGRENRQRRSLQPRELQMGDSGAATKQQEDFSEDWRAHVGATCTTIGIDPRGVAVSDVKRVRGPESREETQSEHGGAYSPVKVGWLRRKSAQILDRCGRKPSSDKEKNRSRWLVEGLQRRTAHISRLLLGVCYAGEVLSRTGEQSEFVNFRVGGDNTFFADGILTHNCGVGSALAGRGADLLLVDDPHSEQDVINGNFSVFEKAYEWFTFGARTRLMPGGRVAVIQTRWSKLDLTGRLVEDMAKNPGADQYKIVEFPAILEIEKEDKETGETRIVQKPLWPEFFDINALLRTKSSMPVFQWNAQYQQQPTSEEAALVKREWWKHWGSDTPPHCEYVISSLDAAAEKHNRADFTALTTWGVFYNEEESCYSLILLNSVKERLEFPELKQLCLDHWKDWQPDSFIVEKKSAGVAIYQELRRMGIPLQEYTPHRGTGDKFVRLNSVADIISSGLVWVPATRWAEEVVEEMAAFPFGSNDDLVDSTVMALMRFRQGGFIRLPSDEMDDEGPSPLRRAAYY